MNRTIKKYTKNILFFLITIFIFIISLEVIFHLLSLVLKKEVVVPKEGFKLLCVGDSTNFGLGATNPSKLSWPAQLSEIYNKKNAGNHMICINKALPGTNSLKTKKILSEAVNDFTPDLVIILTGINDAWNFSGGQIYDYYVADSLFEKIKIFTADILANSKLLRFFKLIKISKYGDFTNETIAYNNKILSSAGKQAEALKKLLQKNISDISNLLEEKKITYFFLEYHAPGWSNPEKIIHNYYKEKKLPYIPMYDYFMSLDLKGINIRSSDGWHPNDYGYRLMALTIADYLCFNYSSDFPAINQEGRN